MEWISVNDRLPGFPQEVMVAYESDADGVPCLDVGVAALFPDGVWRGGGLFYMMNLEHKFQYRECKRVVLFWAEKPLPPE